LRSWRRKELKRGRLSRVLPEKVKLIANRVAQIMGDGEDELQRIGLDEQKWLIDEERRKVTEATLRLTRERQQLEVRCIGSSRWSIS